jgi:hypothetical protein
MNNPARPLALLLALSLVAGYDSLPGEGKTGLAREEVIPQVRYRVGRGGWNQVVEAAVEYVVSPPSKTDAG